jgi:hypothetical protein
MEFYVMVKNIPQRIRKKILLHNSDLSESEKRYLELYGAVNKYSLKTILANTPDLLSWEQSLIRQCVYEETPPERGEFIKKLLERLKAGSELDSQEKPKE